MANINQISPDGGTTVYDIEDTPARSSINSLTPRVGIVEGKVSTLEGQMLSVEDDLDALGTASTKNSTSVVTESTDLVESGAVKDIVGWGNKNLCPTFKGDVINSVTFTVDKDGVVTATGTATGGAGGIVSYFTTKKSKMVIVNGCNSGNPKIQIFPYCVDDNARPYTDETKTARLTSNDNVYNGNELTFYIEQGKTYYLGCRVLAGETVNGQKFYPMLRDANITDPTYEPYHESVSDSLDEKADNSVIGTVEDGTIPTKAYAVGEHMIRGGKFCTVTVAVTTSSTWGNNYVEGDVASACKSVLNEINTASDLANLLPNNHQMCIAYLTQSVTAILTNSEFSMTGKIVACRNVNNIDWFGQFGTDRFAMGRVSADGTYVSHTIIK